MGLDWVGKWVSWVKASPTYSHRIPCAIAAAAAAPQPSKSSGDGGSESSSSSSHFSLPSSNLGHPGQQRHCRWNRDAVHICPVAMVGCDISASAAAVLHRSGAARNSGSSRTPGLRLRCVHEGADPWVGWVTPISTQSIYMFYLTGWIGLRWVDWVDRETHAHPN